jgi:hypothetical protein
MDREEHSDQLFVAVGNAGIPVLAGFCRAGGFRNFPRGNNYVIHAGGGIPIAPDE